MGRTPFYAGGDASGSHRQQARFVANRLAGSGLSYDLLWSAASFVIRDGRQPRDAAVLEEARRRLAQHEASIGSHRARLATPAEAAA